MVKNIIQLIAQNEDKFFLLHPLEIIPNNFYLFIYLFIYLFFYCFKIFMQP